MASTPGARPRAQATMVRLLSSLKRRSVEAASAVETAERRLRSTANEIPRCILLVESWDDIDPFRRLCQRIAGDGLFGGGAAPAFGLYRLQNSRSAAACSAS